jgi:hypothetical protein
MKRMCVCHTFPPPAFFLLFFLGLREAPSPDASRQLAAHSFLPKPLISPFNSAPMISAGMKAIEKTAMKLATTEWLATGVDVRMWVSYTRLRAFPGLPENPRPGRM